MHEKVQGNYLTWCPNKFWMENSNPRKKEKIVKLKRDFPSFVVLKYYKTCWDIRYAVYLLDHPAKLSKKCASASMML